MYLILIKIHNSGGMFPSINIKSPQSKADAHIKGLLLTQMKLEFEVKYRLINFEEGKTMKNPIGCSLFCPESLVKLINLETYHAFNKGALK